MDQEPPPSILDEIEVSRLGPPLSPRARVRRLIISVAAVLLALLVVFAGSPTLRQDARALFIAPTPTRTRPSLPGADSFYFLATPPWVTVLVDGRPLDRVPVADNHPAPLRLPRGVHTFEWRGAPFLTQRCTLPVPLPFLFTPRGSQACVFAPYLVLQQQFMDGPGGVCSAPVWPGLDAAGASATNAGWPPAGRGCVRPSGRRAAAPRGR